MWEENRAVMIVKGDLTRPWAPAGLIKPDCRFHILKTLPNSKEFINHPEKQQTMMPPPPDPAKGQTKAQTH